MVPEKERKGLRKFVLEQLRHESDLSTLTLGILKKRYLAHVRRESLSPEAKKFMKQVVKEELLNMQENAENESDSEVKMPQNKRKRETKQKEVESEEKGSRAKKSRPRVSSSSSDSEDHKTGSPKQAKSHAKGVEKGVRTHVNTEQLTTSEDDSSDEETKKSEQSESENNESPEKMVAKESNLPKTEERSPKTSDGKESAESDEECESGSDEKSEQRDNDRKSSGDENEEVSVEKKNNNSDSDSSSLSSLEDESKEEAEDSKSKKKKKKVNKDQSSQKNDDKAVVRLKRYIALCGVRRNYKKLLNSCKSTRSKVAVLKKELEDLGVHGNLTIEKCKRVRMKREEAQELAELDVGNIINTTGRPIRRGMSTRQEPPSSTYKRALNSGSDTEEENKPDKERRKISEWTNLRGIISDDADSD